MEHKNETSQQALGNFSIDCELDQRGRGFKLADFEFTSSSPLTEQSVGEATLPAASTASGAWAFTVSVARSNRELIDKLDIKASAAARLWGVSVSGRASWFSESHFTAETLVVLITAHWVTEIRSLNVTKLRLKPEAAELMHDDPRRFYDHYGSHFMGSVNLGGQLSVFFKREFSSASEQRAAYAAINGKYGSGSASASALSELASSLDTYHMQAEGFGIGGDPVLPYQDTWHAQEWIGWALNTWMKSVPANPGAMSAELWNVWTVENATSEFPVAIGLADALEDQRALTDWRLRLEQIQAAARYLLDDSESLAPSTAQREQLVAWQGGAAADIVAMQAHYVKNDKLHLEPPARLRANAVIALNPDTVEPALDDLQKHLERRRPLKMNDLIFLSTTGENQCWIAGPREGMGPSMSQSEAGAVVLQVGFQAPRVGGQIRLYSTVGLGDKQQIAVVSRNDWLQYRKRDNSSDQQKWTIEAKREGGDACIRHGDHIRLTSVKYPDMTIKARQKDGIWWAKAMSFTSHWLLIHRAD